MPPVIAPVIASALVAAGTTATVATVAANVIAYAIVTAASVGLSLLLGGPKKEKSDPSQIQVKQALPSRQRGYGRHKVSGALGFMESRGGSLVQLLIHCEGPITAYEEWWLNDKNTLIPGEGGGGANGVLPWGSNVVINSYVGSIDQPAAVILTDLFPDNWTADHQLKGLAYSVVRYGPVREKFFQKVYPNGAPALRVVARLSMVYDPRTGATTWSENAALCIRDYLTSPRGFGLPQSRINEASFAAFANICDEPVALKAGGTEPRYRLGGLYDLTEEPREVLRRMLSTCDGEIVPFPDGTVGIRGGVWTAPSVVLDDSVVLSYEIEQGNDKLAAFNRLKLTYTSPLHDYQPVEAEAWENFESQDELGEVLTQDLTLAMVQSHAQARRLAKINMAKGNPRWRLTLVTNMAGLDALGERTVHIRIAELGIDEPFLINTFEIAGDMTGCTMGLTSLDATAYAWDAVAEEGEAPPLPQDTSAPLVIPAPDPVVLSFVDQNIYAGITNMKVRAEVPVQSNAALKTIGRIRNIDTLDWTEMAVEGDWKVISDVLTDGETYDVQAALAGFASYSQSEWSPSQYVTAASTFRNFLVPSTDPQDWPPLFSGDYAFGGTVDDPFNGTGGRRLAFNTAGAGFWYGVASVGTSVAGKTFHASLWARSASGKAQVVLRIRAEPSGEGTYAVLNLTSSWQRFSVSQAFTVSDTSVSIGIDNRAAFFAGLNGAAGEIDVFGGQIEQTSLTEYQARV